MAPFDLFDLLGWLGGILGYMAIGFGFGFILESAGFGDSRRLAGQFYFKDNAVIRVMFTAVVTAMLLIFLTSGMGVLDYEDIWVNPTFLLPGLAGGAIMGVGFVIGGYCPGTSLTSVGTLKADGIAFVGGLFIGFMAFGELADELASFMVTTDYGRWTLFELFGVPTSVIVVGVVAMASGLFVAITLAKKALWGEDDLGEFQVAGRTVHPAWLAAPAVLIALMVVALGQPTLDEKWELRADEYQAKLDSREIYVEPSEVLEYMYNTGVELRVLDVRAEADYNLFHLKDAANRSIDELDCVYDLAEKPNRLWIVTSNDEALATEAWKRLTTMKVANVYILEGGINHWLAEYGHDVASHSEPVELTVESDDSLRHDFDMALGARHPAAKPDHHVLEHAVEHRPEDWEKRIKLVLKARKGGGCG